MIETSPELQATIDRYMPYLQEIRRRLLLVFSVFLVGGVIGFVYFEPIVKAIMNFYDLEKLNIVFTSPFQFINLAINSGVVVGIITVFPFFIYQLLSFLRPALKKNEYRFLVLSIPPSIVLFLIGFLFGNWIMKFVVDVFAQQSSDLQIESLWDIESFLSKIFTTSVFLGLFFQFPVVLTGSIKLKITKLASIEKLRVPAYVALLIITTLLPPTDIFSNVMIFLPLAFLFELTLLLNRFYIK